MTPVMEPIDVHVIDGARAQWCAAFVRAQAQLVNPPKTERAKVKTKTGTDYSYGYASLPDIIDSVRQVLFDNGLAFTQMVTTRDGMVGVFTTIIHSAGHAEAYGPLLMPAGSTPQEYGSAITYARRYALCAVLGIAADEDDDGAKESRKRTSSESSSVGPGSKPADVRAMGKGSASAGTTSSGEDETPRAAQVERSTVASPGDSSSDGSAGNGVSQPSGPSEANPATLETSAGDSTSVPPDPAGSSEVSERGSKPTCSVNGPFHIPDPERSMKARPGWVVCVCGESERKADIALEADWLEAVSA